MQEGPTVASQQPGAPAAVQIEAGPTTAAQTIAIPQSVQEIAGLRSRRSELVDQLNRASNRREEVIRDMRDASNAERAGLEQRLAALDSRMVQIEADIAATERALTNASPAMLGAAAQAEEAAALARRQAEPPIDAEVIAVVASMGMILLLPIVIAYARRVWKRPQPTRALPPVTEGRLERIEQAVESIAVEVERVSEGQRFVTKLMSEGKVAPIASPREL
ncbi:MAG TPA: hypothetical protein VMM17_01990 [Gemmatimonadaceae bacterium]|nr:hypothetical protein [Gemmatimonadaceae bacterium]